MVHSIALRGARGTCLFCAPRFSAAMPLPLKRQAQNRRGCASRLTPGRYALATLLLKYELDDGNLASGLREDDGEVEG